MRSILALVVVLITACGAAQPGDRYAEGQVWEYRARPAEAGSLMKIQKIEPVPNGGGERVYHVSIIGIRLTNPRVSPILQHLPVSRETLDRSVTRLGSGGDFPDLAQVKEGIATWREAEGGIFTISLAEIVGLMDEQTRDLGQ